MDQELALELYELCKAEQPDMQRAKELIRSGRIDLSAPSKPGSFMCFLSTAIDFCNYEIAEMLLENGADPNSEAEEYGYALTWACLLEREETRKPKADAEKQFKIARLLLEKGADASGGDENALDYVVWRTFSGHDCVPMDDEYSMRTIILMFAYGASAFYKADFLKTLDKDHLENYSLEQIRRPDGRWGHGIVDQTTGEIVAYLNL